MSESPGGERVFVAVPCNWEELSELEQEEWIGSLYEYLVTGSRPHAEVSD